MDSPMAIFIISTKVLYPVAARSVKGVIRTLIPCSGLLNAHPILILTFLCTFSFVLSLGRRSVSQPRHTFTLRTTQTLRRLPR